MKFIFRVFCFLAITYAIAFPAGYIVDKGLRKSHDDEFEVWNEIYNSGINTAMIFSGPSKTIFHISPKIMDSMLNINTYNIGMDGWQFCMQYTRFKIYLMHNKAPEYVVQNVDLGVFIDNENVYEARQFLPYLNDRLIQKITDRYTGRFSLPEKYYPLFKYNGNFDLVKKGVKLYFNLAKDRPELLYKGYRGVNRSWDSSFASFKAAHPNGLDVAIDKRTEEEFEDFLKLCRQKNIKVILDLPPSYIEEQNMVNNRQIVMDKIKRYAAKYNCPLLDYSKDSLSYNKEYFYNSQHLNSTGSAIFSSKLANDLKIYISR